MSFALASSLPVPQVLQQLDEEGCARTAKVLKQLPQENILIIGQADSFVTQVRVSSTNNLEMESLDISL